MNSCVRISEMTLLAYHAIALIARSKTGALGASEIAAVTQKSQNTLHKVMQRLAKEGIVDSSRGRGGGFVLKKQPGEVELLQVYEMFEGRIEKKAQILGKGKYEHCLGELEKCIFSGCLFGSVVRDIDRKFIAFLHEHTVADLMK